MPASLRAALCLFLCASVLAAAQGRASGGDPAESESGTIEILHAIVKDEAPATWPFVLAEPGDTVWVNATNNHPEHNVRIMYPARYREALSLGKSGCVIDLNDGHEVDPLVCNDECFMDANDERQQQEEDTTTCEQATSQSLESNCRAVDWSSERPRRACLAAMVSLVYCAIKNKSVTSLEPEWLSNSTGFHLFDPLVDNKKIYTAIYEYVGVDKSAPDYMFVFRGTSFCRPSVAMRDNIVNLQIAFNNALCCKRFTRAYKKAKGLVKSLSKVKDPVVWLTGHSQGAWLALNVGREMKLEGHNVSAFLFNPPLGAACCLNKRLKGLCEVGCRVAEAIKCKTRINSTLMEQELEKLRDWAPYAYAHERDWRFCKCFIDYFQHPMDLDKRTMVLPSVVLCKNSGAEVSPHDLKNWLNSNTGLKYRCKRYPAASPRDTVRALQHSERVTVV